jgi:thiol-disulfide isomerase/thioredoxin
MQKKVFIVFLVISLPMLGQTEKAIPVFDEFEDAAHLFQPATDTLWVINFWASWCSPCVHELPAIEKARKGFGNQKVSFLLVSLDPASKLESHVKPLLSRLNIDAKVVLLDDTDYNSWIDKVDPSWSGAIPGTLIVNSKGKRFYEQSFTYEELKQTINNHLKQ